MSDVLLERRPDGVAVIRLDRPKLNPLSGALLADLFAIVDALSSDLLGRSWCGVGSGVSLREPT
jgi:enoyl-CoA hydratase/carnithine racemase